MPKIPELTPQVRTAPASQARFTVRADAEDFGAGIGRGVQQVGGQLAQVARKQRDDANALAVTDADRQLSELETQLLYDADSGALNVKGKDALALPDTVLPEFDKAAGKIRAALANDEQRLAFDRVLNSRRTGVDRTVQRHVSSEYETYDKVATDAALANSLEAAANNYRDTTRIATELERQRGYILSRAERTGQAAEVTQAQLADLTSKTHIAVIDRMLADGDYRAAKAYYTANGEDVAGTAKAGVEEAIQVGVLRGEAQTKTDALVAGYATRADALREARKISDPQLRDEVVTRVNRRFDEQDAINTERRQQAVRTATDLISNGGTVDDIPPQDWAIMDRDTRSNLRALAARGEWYQDDQRWYQFTRKVQEDPATVAGMNLFAELRPYVDDAHWNEALRIQQAAQKALKGDPSDFNNELSFEQRLNDSLVAAGIFEKTSGLEGDEAQRYARLRTEAARVVEQESVAKGRKLTGQEIKQITDQVASRTVFEKGWFIDSEVRAAEVEVDDAGDTYVPLARIPDADLAFMNQVAERLGARVTQDKAQRAYAAYLLGDRKLFNEILQEPTR